MKEESREFAMELLATMVVMDRAKREKCSTMDVFKKFRRSGTFEQLFDSETGLWMNGPDYISYEYDLELETRTAR